jgi:predicted RNA-binding Zn ribbon-like protein
MTVTAPFLFVGGAPALDFVNTELVLHGEHTDLLCDSSALFRWLSESGLAGGAQRRARDACLPEVKALRAHLRRTFLHLSVRGRLRPSDLAPIHDVLAGTRGSVALQLRDGAPRLDFVPEGGGSPAFIIARAAAEFLTSADLSLVKTCEGSGCILVFHDTTKSHTRRWCSMAACGNRRKVAAHYQRLLGE